MNKNLEKLTAFLVDLEDLCKERGIGFFDDIPKNLELKSNDDGWFVVVRFEVGRDEIKETTILTN